MSRAARALAWRLPSIAISIAMIGAASPACSLVDGWSDLQGGSTPHADAGKDKDTSTPEADGDVVVPQDASTDTNMAVDSGVHDVTCGVAHCPIGLGCCVGFTSGKQCTMESACDVADGAMFLRCSDVASCSASAPVCCYDNGDQTSSCLAGCGPGQNELCVPTGTNKCTAGKTCSGTLAGTSNVPACR